MTFFKSAKPKFFIGLIGLVFLFCFTGCADKVSGELVREENFTLSYGAFENELNLFNLTSTYTRPDTQIFMNGGIFYITNSGGQKILKLSSFGDLLSIFYNPETNTPPSFLKSGQEEQADAATRKAIQYPLNHPGLLAVTDSKQLFVVDSVAEDKIEYDHEENLALRDIILSFNEEENFVDYIGQEGLGGTPFPSIEGIYTNASNDLIVICRTQSSIKIYWYNSAGSLLYKIPIFFDSIPIPYDDGKIFSSIDKAIPDFKEARLYLKIDYYIGEQDPATQANLGINYDKSSVYFLNIETGKYDSIIDIEPYESTENISGEDITFKKVYELAGITENGWCYLTTPTPAGYALVMLNLKTQKTIKKDLVIADSETVYNAFNISPKGIISGLLAGENSACVAWWRADKLIGETDGR